MKVKDKTPPLGKSTMFPDSWSENDILSEVQNNVKDTNFVKTQYNGNKVYENQGKDGINIRTVTDLNGKIITGFPIL